MVSQNNAMYKEILGNPHCNSLVVVEWDFLYSLLIQIQS